MVRERELNDIVNLVEDILKEGKIIEKKKKMEGREEKEKEEKSLRDEL